MILSGRLQSFPSISAHPKGILHRLFLIASFSGVIGLRNLKLLQRKQKRLSHIVENSRLECILLRFLWCLKGFLLLETNMSTLRTKVQRMIDENPAYKNQSFSPGNNIQSEFFASGN